MRVGFQNADFDALAELWARVHPERYRVTPALLRANTTGSRLFDWGASFIESVAGAPVGFTAVKRPATRFYKGPDKDQAHLTGIAFDDPAVGIDLMAATKQVLRDRGIYRLRFGQDTSHFFPGCPSDCQALRDFLIVAGFEEGEAIVDLERDLEGYAPSAGTLDVLKAWSADAPPELGPGEARHDDEPAPTVHEQVALDEEAGAAAAEEDGRGDAGEEGHRRGLMSRAGAGT